MDLSACELLAAERKYHFPQLHLLRFQVLSPMHPRLSEPIRLTGLLSHHPPVALESPLHQPGSVIGPNRQATEMSTDLVVLLKPEYCDSWPNIAAEADMEYIDAVEERHTFVTKLVVCAQQTRLTRRPTGRAVSRSKDAGVLQSKCEDLDA